MTTSAPISPRSEGGAAVGLGLVAAIAAISIVGFSISVTQPLFAVLMEGMGISGLWIGVSNSTLAFAILGGGLLMPRVLRRTGLPGLLVGATLGATALLLLVPVLRDYWVWTGLRLLFSLCVTALFYASELWIVAAAPAERRGLWLGVYGLFLAIGFFLGPILLALVGTQGWAPFLAAAAVMLLTLVPLVLARAQMPRDLDAGHGSVGGTLRFFRTDPSLLWGAVLFGCFEFGALGLLPVWALREGLGEDLAVLLVALVALGNAVLQLPLGYLSDRLNRRALMGVSAAGVLAIGVLLPLWSGWPAGLMVLMALAGGLAFGLYQFPLAELGARYRGEALVQANGAMIFAYGLGALVAPVMLGQLLDLIPPDGMPHGLTALALAYIALLVWRAGRRRA